MKEKTNIEKKVKRDPDRMNRSGGWRDFERFSRVSHSEDWYASRHHDSLGFRFVFQKRKK